MKTKTKRQLQERIAELEAENASLRQELADRVRWDEERLRLWKEDQQRQDELYSYPGAGAG